jgi:hypothetical protein
MGVPLQDEFAGLTGCGDEAIRRRKKAGEPEKT